MFITVTRPLHTAIGTFAPGVIYGLPEPLSHDARTMLKAHLAGEHGATGFVQKAKKPRKGETAVKNIAAYGPVSNEALKENTPAALRSALAAAQADLTREREAREAAETATREAQLVLTETQQKVDALGNELLAASQELKVERERAAELQAQINNHASVTEESKA